MEPWQLQPARDTGLTPAERFRSVRRESGLLESVAQQACFSVLRIYFAIAHRLTISGREKLPAHGPFVLAANHCSHLDALVLGAALRPRHRERAFPIAAGDVFFQTTAVSVFSAIMLNALPMWRKNCGPHALAELRRKLQEEKAIFIIFPEGGRTRTGSMMPFKHGLGMLVAETNVPVVPCGLIGSFEALPPNRKVPRPVRIKLIDRRASELCSRLQTIVKVGHRSRSANRRRNSSDPPILAAPLISQAGLPASRMFRVPLQLLRQIRRNVRDDQSIVALISQFEDVTNPMDLRDQRAFVRGNPKPRAQSP